MNGTVAPLLIENEPTVDAPTVDTITWAAGRVHVIAIPAVPALMVGPPVTVPAIGAPPSLMLHERTFTLLVPMLVKVTMQSLPATEQVVTCPETWAELVNDPNRPKTNPAMAMAAIRVIAMRMTVASTGEIAVLFFPLSRFIIELWIVL